MRIESFSLEKIIAYWPLLAALGLGAAGYLKMSYRVDELEIKQAVRDSKTDEFRDRRNNEMESIRMRLTILETKEKSCGRGLGDR